MRRDRFFRYLVIAFAVMMVVTQTFYVVDQREQGVVLRFGDPVRVVNAGDDSPGLKVKIPFLEKVVKFDKRNQAF